MFSFLKTPNMDRLTREGVHFRNAFVTFSLCTPSRASILTGQYVHTHGVNALGMDFPRPTRTFPEFLKEAGYDTGFAGKWHIGRESELPRAGYNFWAAFRGQGAYFDPLLNVNGARTPTKGYVTDVLTDQALEFLARKRDRPFFCTSRTGAARSSPPPKHLEGSTRMSVSYPSLPSDDESRGISYDHAFHYMFHPRSSTSTSGLCARSSPWMRASTGAESARRPGGPGLPPSSTCR
jgi:N-acetylglucosamine-6-sulfatase